MHVATIWDRFITADADMRSFFSSVLHDSLFHGNSIITKMHWLYIYKTSEIGLCGKYF